MGGLAFVFSGQGDQRSGMGKDLYHSSRTAARVMDRFEVLRPGTLDQCFFGTDSDLKLTANAQPCLFAVELAAASALVDSGAEPDAVAGFSLGEVVAATFAGVFDYDTGFELVCKRGELMGRAAAERPTFMAAILGLGHAQVEEACEQLGDVYPANYNCPGQTVVSGPEDRLQALKETVNELNGRTIVLKAQGGFHSLYMDDAAEGFAVELERASIGVPRVPVYSNVTAFPYVDDAVLLLARQVNHPVRWEDTIRNMIAEGIDRFVEVGSGKTLSNMIRRIDAGAKTIGIADFGLASGEEGSC